MTVEKILLEIENLTDEELDNLINSLNQIKINKEKEKEKREKLISEFKFLSILVLG